MAEVHIVDIDGEQWDIKDLPLTQKVGDIQTDVSENTEQINLIKNEMYYSKRKSFISNSPRIEFLKLENLSPKITRQTNVFVVTERNGGYGLLSVGVGDDIDQIFVSYIRCIPGTRKINRVFLTGDNIYFEMALYWFVEIIQIAGNACDIRSSISTVEPSGTPIEIKELAFK